MSRRARSSEESGCGSIASARSAKRIASPSRPAKGKTTESQQASAARGRLSPREREIAELLAKGLSRPQVAAQLDLSPYTVVSLSQRIYEKLGIRRRAELARIMLMRI